MTQIASTQTAAKSSFTQPQGNSINDLDQDQFLNLIITELQNQDPLAPTDNAALLEQVGQLRSLAANDQLMSTLDNFGITQELTTASNLIGKKVDGVDSVGKKVNGTVSSVSVQVDENDRDKREVRVHVGNQTVDIKNIREIVPSS
jgi:flagellar basal-body rod modification protein FlgD